MTKQFPIAEKTAPQNLPAGFIPVSWDDYGSSIIGMASGRRVKFWPMDRVLQSLPPVR